MLTDQIYVLGSDGNLWLEQGPFHGVQIPPPRVQIDGSVDLLAAFQAVTSLQVLVCGSDGNLWFEQGPFGPIPLPDAGYPPPPTSRYRIDGNVAAFFSMPTGEVFVLGRDGDLWLEYGFGTTIPSVPPPRDQIDGSVVEFQPLSTNEVFVLGQDGNLWHEWGGFGTVPLPPCTGKTIGCRTQVDAQVFAFMAVDSNHVFVLDRNGDLWLDQGPFGGTVPPPRTHIDGNVASFWAESAGLVYVLGRDGHLWQENAPFDQVPLPPCSQTSGFGKGFGCRSLIFSNVAAYGVFPDADGVFVVDGNLDLWLVGTPNVKIDGNVIDFQPLNPAQMLSRPRDGSETARPAVRPIRPVGRHRPRSAGRVP